MDPVISFILGILLGIAFSHWRLAQKWAEISEQWGKIRKEWYDLASYKKEHT